MTEQVEQIQISPPSEFDFTCPEEWLLWISRFEHFGRALTKLNSSRRSKSTLYGTEGGICYQIPCVSRDLTADRLKDYDIVTLSPGT